MKEKDNIINKIFLTGKSLELFKRLFNKNFDDIYDNIHNQANPYIADCEEIAHVAHIQANIKTLKDMKTDTACLLVKYLDTVENNKIAIMNMSESCIMLNLRTLSNNVNISTIKKSCKIKKKNVNRLKNKIFASADQEVNLLMELKGKLTEKEFNELRHIKNLDQINNLREKYYKKFNI